VRLPRSFARSAAAASAVHAGLTADVLADRLRGVTVVLSTAADRRDPLAPAYLVAANLLARLYPTLLLQAPSGLLQDAREIVLAINPAVGLQEPGGTPPVRRVHLQVGRRIAPAAADVTDVVTVDAAGWVAAVDAGAPDGVGPPAAPSALAAGAIGAGEVFRAVFGEWLPDGGRRGPAPALWDLVTGVCRAPAAGDGDGAADWTADLGGTTALGTVHLAGAGAVGQAAVLTWRAAGASGELVVVDHETVDVGNLQRYVLTDDASEGTAKTEVVARALASSGLAVRQARHRWGQGEESAPGRGVVAVALDTADGRLAVAAGAHSRVYNAWTGAVDLGWSRHETFGGHEPCLACLYLPTGPRPSLHEQIASALGQDPLRIRMYLPPGSLLSGLPSFILPLPGEPLPPEADGWTARSLLDDLIATGVLPAADRGAWAARHVLDLWHEGVCGGTLLVRPGDLPDVPVPLAHQSALAGIMLATQLLVAADPVLRDRRDAAGQGRLDLLRALPQVVGRPKQVTAGCLCRDPDYVRAAAVGREAEARSKRSRDPNGDGADPQG